MLNMIAKITQKFSKIIEMKGGKILQKVEQKEKYEEKKRWKGNLPIHWCSEQRLEEREGRNFFTRIQGWESPSKDSLRIKQNTMVIDSQLVYHYELVNQPERETEKEREHAKKIAGIKNKILGHI